MEIGITGGEEDGVNNEDGKDTARLARWIYTDMASPS
jgi:hypothetical protein